MSDVSLTYNYQLQQLVRLVRVPFSGRRGNVPNLYEVIRLMPADTSGEISYRIRSGVSELCVREHEIKS